MWKYLVFYTLISGVLLERQKRFLLSPKGRSRMEVVVGVGVPVDLDLETVIIGSVLKGNYLLPTNLSQFTPDIIYERRKKRSASRWTIYKVFENVLEMRGFSGKSCMLRAICEVADKPLAKNYDLFGELAHLILTPSSTNEKDVAHYTDSEYYAAQVLGKHEGKCDSHFHECTASLMDMFTMVYGNEIGF